MCGITGFYSVSGKFSERDLRKMTSSLTHRGPDAEGFFCENGVGLGHRRLSILDLSDAANQPMVSSSGRYVIVFNGEVYNFKEVAALLDVKLKTSGDTEVILEAFEKFGPDFVHYLNGMFAIAIYDKLSRSLYLFRGRMGIKPLFYVDNSLDFAFASETKALLQLPIEKSINKEALKDYFFLEYVPGNQSIFNNIKKLDPGHWLLFNENGIQIKKYYDILEKFSPRTFQNENKLVEEYLEQVHKSVKYQSISDVPIGAFLSGGVDSSLICSVFQEQNKLPINTFTIGFNIKEFDESKYANAVAAKLNTIHSLTPVDDADAKKIIYDLVEHYDEPFAAPSIIPSLIVCNIARRNVKVVLSGDGGDELFMGYGYYNWYNRINKVSAFGGYAARKLASFLLNSFNGKYQRAARLLDFRESRNFWLHAWSQEQNMFNEKEISLLFNEPYKHKTLVNDWEKIDSMKIHPFEKISLFDIKNYLASNLLYKMDIASMASSLEVRVPYLDHNLVEFSINTPLEFKIRKKEHKYLMKKALERYLPHELIYRRKWGFPAPIGDWLKGDLSFLVDQYLNRNLIIKQGIFNPDMISALVVAFKGGDGFHYKRIWSLIFFQMWYGKYIDNI